MAHGQLSPNVKQAKYLTDEQVLRTHGVTDFSGYACNPATIDQIQKDFFLD